MDNPNAEINRLRELMPASARMKIRIMLSEAQTQVITAEFPKPWKKSIPITLNLSLWRQLSQPQRDLLFLRTVCWVNAVNILKPDWYQGLAAAGLLGTVVELVQLDAVGVVVAGGLTGLAGYQIWRSNKGTRAVIGADDKAIEVAQRRNYTEAEAAQALLTAIEAVPRIEGYSGLSVTDLIRCQNLRNRMGAAHMPVTER